MLYLNFSQFKDRIEKQLDMEEETFISPEEWIILTNKAIDEAEQHVMSIYQEYFKTAAFLPLVKGVQKYKLADNIYANKITHIYFKEGNTHYKINRIKPKHSLGISDSDDYYYDLEFDTATVGDTGIRLVLYPVSRHDGNLIKYWYIRNANRIIDDNSIIDLPEAINFLTAYMTREVYKKEGHHLFGIAEQELTKQTQLYKETLDNMVPDEDETIKPDLSFYIDFESDLYRGF